MSDYLRLPLTQLALEVRRSEARLKAETAPNPSALCNTPNEARHRRESPTELPKLVQSCTLPDSRIAKSPNLGLATNYLGVNCSEDFERLWQEVNEPPHQGLRCEFGVEAVHSCALRRTQ